jgi:HEPN domain-containing protein
MKPNDDPRTAEAREWLAKADLDLRAGWHDLSAEPPLLEDALFHAQQAAEKSLKAFLVWHDQPFRKTHDLRTLGQQCVAYEPSLKGLMQRTSRLSQYAWKYRYPGEIEPPLLSEAQNGLELAGEVRDEIHRILPHIVSCN